MKTVLEIRSNEELKDLLGTGAKVEYLFFYGHYVPANGRIVESCFSQWYPVSFEVDGIGYSNAEQFMMAEKARLFDDQESLEKILKNSSPRESKKLGRQVVGFDQEKWSEQCFEIVVKGNYHKFKQNKSLKNFLLKTGEKIIVEASPRDRIWGIGLSIKNEKTKDPANWRGRNLLGYALMEVRSALSSTE